ncbi:hypothetical protein SDC9_162749 [bioreactor metagenome]|uniref:Uncharacterized protein n=1 Tax=bioreactor metagenome TaxID=1076179 RepID=A0A645FLY0_9ZZZZ
MFQRRVPHFVEGNKLLSYHDEILQCYHISPFICPKKCFLHVHTQHLENMATDILTNGIIQQSCLRGFLKLENIIGGTDGNTNLFFAA